MAERASWFTHPVVGGVLGVFAGALVILLIESAGHLLLGTADPAVPGSITTPMMASVLVAWVAGAFTAGMVATIWTGSRTILPGAIAGLVLLSASVATMMAIPHPVWMMVGAVVLMPAAAWLAGRARVARRSAT